MRQAFWEAYYSLQSVGLIPPIVLFFYMAHIAKNAEDKKAVSKWLIVKAVQFVGLFVLVTGALSVLEAAGIINLLAD